MNNSLVDLLILKTFKLYNTVSKTPRIIEIEWKKPNTRWIKVNTNGAVNGSPGIAGYGGIFQTYRGFCKGCFAKPLGVLYAFEAELYGVITAVEYAIRFQWTH
ncbi:hypothetical protein TIFTF001_022429 [Ficus carica]|uniref:RNase H type-1 domain-containing protein n=1 Tax=Ficus carica TaxID=3494 RepID=A0AA88AJ72_FICCA|nr:hypothetical protein TIFTF001_022429 [Ficus carica]